MYDTFELADLINRSHWAIIMDRKKGRGIPYVRTGGNQVRYRASDIAAYLDANTVRPGESDKSDRTVKPAPAVVQNIRTIPPHLRGIRGFR